MAFDPFAPLDVNLNAIHPIIYVRGFAATRNEIDETSADPFCGFNLGSTIFRATPDEDRKTRKFVFESPVVRLAKDFDYRDVYVDGSDVVHEDDWPHGISRRSIIVHRYYDSSSSILGGGKTPPIEDFAIALSRLIARVKHVVMAKREYPDEASFRCYLVAHSMGGLVCRAFLQNPDCDPEHMRSAVDKFFTYATPHNGVELGGINVPAWLTKLEVDNFNRERMAEYLEDHEVVRRREASRLSSSRIISSVEGTIRSEEPSWFPLSPAERLVGKETNSPPKFAGCFGRSTASRD